MYDSNYIISVGKLCGGPYLRGTQGRGVGGGRVSILMAVGGVITGTWF